MPCNYVRTFWLLIFAELQSSTPIALIGLLKVAIRVVVVRLVLLCLMHD